MQAENAANGDSFKSFKEFILKRCADLAFRLNLDIDIASISFSSIDLEELLGLIFFLWTRILVVFRFDNGSCTYLFMLSIEHNVNESTCMCGSGND